MRAGQDREPHDVDVFLDRFLHDLLGHPLEPRIDNLDSRVAERVCHDLGAPVVPMEPRLRDEHPHAGRNAASQRALPPGSSATRSGTSRTRCPTATDDGSASTRIEKTRRPAIFTIAKKSGPSQPAGSPASWTVNAWIVPSLDRSAQSNRSEPHSPQNPRGGPARRTHAAARVVATRR